MKGALIIGMIHMVFGMFLKIFNNVYFKNFLDLVTETIPQIIFYNVFFTLMGFAIVYKWTFNFIDEVRCWDPSDLPISSNTT